MIILIETIHEPLPRSMRVGKYYATKLHKGQPSKSDSMCNKCLEVGGHKTHECPNDWKCRLYKKSGHKQGECEEQFQDENDEDNEDNSNAEDEEVEEEIKTTQHEINNTEQTKTPNQIQTQPAGTPPRKVKRFQEHKKRERKIN